MRLEKEKYKSKMLDPNLKRWCLKGTLSILMRIGILAILFLGVAMQSRAQTFLDVNRQTTTLFEEQDWPALIRAAEKVLDADFDFFGLRYRLGVAYYEQGRFFASTRQFERALAYDGGNRYVLEYLYYAYLFSGREKQARVLAAEFPAALREKLDLQQVRLLDFLYLEGGAKQSNLVDSIGTLPFFTLGLRQRVGRRLDLYHAVSYLEQNFFQTDFQQWEYYLRADWQLGKITTLHPAVHVIDLSGETQIDGTATPVDQNVRAGYLGWTIAPGRWRIHPFYAFSRSETQFFFYDGTRFLRGADTFSTSQWGLTLTYVPPVLRDRIWLQGSLGRYDSEIESRTLYGMNLWIYPLRRLALQLGYFDGGNAPQFLEAQGAIVNNSIGGVDDRWTVGLELRTDRQHVFTLGYQQEHKLIEERGFFYQTLFLGIKLEL